MKSFWRHRTSYDDINDSISFLKRERQHMEQLFQLNRREDLSHRERSIDDGSHFDPRLDKYPMKYRLNGTKVIDRKKLEQSRADNKKPIPAPRGLDKVLR